MRANSWSPNDILYVRATGSGGDVQWVGGGGRLHPQGKDPWSVEEKVLPLPQASRELRQWPTGKTQVSQRERQIYSQDMLWKVLCYAVGLVWCGASVCVLDIWILLHSGLPYRYASIISTRLITNTLCGSNVHLHERYRVCLHWGVSR